MPLLCSARFSGEKLRNGSHLFLHHSGNNVHRRSVSIGLCLRRVWRKPDGCAAAAGAAARRRQSQFGPTGGRRAERARAAVVPLRTGVPT